jgi:hypothetical protein
MFSSQIGFRIYEISINHLGAANNTLQKNNI